MKPKQNQDQPQRAEAQADEGRANPMDKHIEQWGGDLATAERKAGREVDYSGGLVPLALGMFAVLMSYFLPHSGQVFGYDVLFYSPRAEDFDTTMPERIYTWLALAGGVLLVIGTIVSKSWLVAWVNWFFAGVGWWYSVFAIWMGQTRPVTSAGEGPSYGLVLGAVGMTMVFITMSFVLFRRNPLQKALARKRREDAHRDEASRMAQQRLRTGLIERVSEDPLVDDRRARAKARREKRRAEERGVEGRGVEDRSAREDSGEEQRDADAEDRRAGEND